MKTLFSFLVSGFLFCSFGLAQDKSEFPFDIYKKSVKPGQNLFISPFSISSALTMASAGARGKTFDEMAKVLGLSKDPNAFYLGMNPKFESSAYHLVIANRLWGRAGQEYSKDFLKRLTDNYNSDLIPLDFQNKTEESRITINKWVEEKTNAKIKDLLSEGSVVPSTNLVITNAIYFKAAWADHFESLLTKPRPFHASDDGAKSIPFMNRHAWYYFAKDQDVKMIEIPYKGMEVSMVLILPNSQTGLSDFESKLTAKRFISLHTSGRSKEVILSIPKFKTESSLELSENLKNLGMIEAFDQEKANFKGMLKNQKSDQRLFISKVIHKAYVDVDENGTEAAAATAVPLMAGAAMRESEKPEEFIADHPFIYFIRHQASGAILFIGRFVNP